MPGKADRHPEDILPEEQQVLCYLGLIADLTVRFTEDPTVIGTNDLENYDYDIVIERPEVYEEAIQLATSPKLGVKKRLESLQALHWHELRSRFPVETEPSNLSDIWTDNPYREQRFKKIIFGIGFAIGKTADNFVHPVTDRPRSL